jgi:hypothetical protein
MQNKQNVLPPVLNYFIRTDKRENVTITEYVKGGYILIRMVCSGTAMAKRNQTGGARIVHATYLFGRVDFWHATSF